ncbi:MAG TPA: hypothetical protein VFR09_06155 [Alphaproteobacteria bacterium]|nr:hypothetical protein [Alphaproteobacteria bacterium]
MTNNTNKPESRIIDWHDDTEDNEPYSLRDHAPVDPMAATPAFYFNNLLAAARPHIVPDDVEIPKALFESWRSFSNGPARERSIDRNRVRPPNGLGR